MADLDHATLMSVAVGSAPPTPPHPPAPGLSTTFRAAPPHNAVRPQLGALADLPGTWVGKGFNIVALPAKHENKIFRLMLNATTEFITFTLIGGPIPDRGFLQDDISFVGVHYFQQVVDRATSAGLHLEPGMWLNLPATTAPLQPATVARLSTIPHGDSLLAQGPSFSVVGGPKIDTVSTLPFRLDQTTGAPVRQFPLGYTDPYMTAPLPPGIPQGSGINPNLVLLDAIKGQNIVKTVVLFVNATPVGGINGTPLAPPSKPNDVGGIVNIPFVKANADANSLSAIFWIETVQNPDGSQFLQLQYTQTTILDFDGIKWPHISVGTLIQQ